jgi:hypothetical protein
MSFVDSKKKEHRSALFHRSTQDYLATQVATAGFSAVYTQVAVAEPAAPVQVVAVNVVGQVIPAVAEAHFAASEVPALKLHLVASLQAVLVSFNAQAKAAGFLSHFLAVASQAQPPSKVLFAHSVSKLISEHFLAPQLAPLKATKANDINDNESNTFSDFMISP